MAFDYRLQLGNAGAKHGQGYQLHDTFAKANIGLLNSRGIQYTVSTGGANGLFTCSSTSGADMFLNRYLGPQLQGLDFNIEIHISPDQLSKLMQSVLYLQRKNPKLTISFILWLHQLVQVRTLLVSTNLVNLF